MHCTPTFPNLAPEIHYKIFDFIYYHCDPKDLNTSIRAYFGGPYDPTVGFGNTFWAISQAIPELLPLCMRYENKWVSLWQPINDILASFVFEKPELKDAVDTLDLITLWGPNTIGKPKQFQPLLDYARAGGYLSEDFDEKEMSDWVGLALQLLPGIKNLWLGEENMVGTHLSIRHFLTNHIDNMHALRHVSIKPKGLGSDFNFTDTISRLLDLPRLESVTLSGAWPEDPDQERMLLNAYVKRPEKLQLSQCTYFSFDYSLLTDTRLSIIAARCKPRILKYEVPEEPTSVNSNAYQEGHKELLNDLEASPIFRNHLQILLINQDECRTFMSTDHAIDLTPFRNLHHLSISAHTLVGNNLASNNIRISTLLPSSLESLKLDFKLNISSLSTTKKLEEEAFLDQVINILDDKPAYFPKLRTFDTEMSALVGGDIHWRKRGQVGRLAGALSRARANGVLLAGFPVKPGKYRLVPNWSHGVKGQLVVRITEHTVEVRVAKQTHSRIPIWQQRGA